MKGTEKTAIINSIFNYVQRYLGQDLLILSIGIFILFSFC